MSSAPLPTTGAALYRWAQTTGVLREVIAWGRRNGHPDRVLEWPPRTVSDGYAVGRSIQIARSLADDDDEEEVP